MSDRPLRRRQYKLGERRVVVADLIEAGFVEPGAELVLRKPRVGEEYHGTVTETGSIRLPDGQEFSYPSRAAAVAAGVPSIDGWEAWTTAASGETLDALRQRVLDTVAEDSAATGPASDAPGWSARDRHEYLREARQRADEGEPVELTVRDLIGRWGASARGALVVQRVSDELADHGLTTTPDFRAVGLDSLVALTHPPPEPDDDKQEPSTAPREMDVGLTLGNIPSALSGVTSVSPDATLDEAITVMRLNGYSQVPVLSGPRTVRGAVTWKSIAEARHFQASATLRDAIVRVAEARFDQELIDVLDDLYRDDFVLVRDAENKIVGIVTTADVVLEYGELATPFFLIGEIDRRLRWLLGQTFTVDEIATHCDPDGVRGICSTDDLSFGDYTRMLEHPGHWARLGWPLDRGVFVARLHEIRAHRNDLTHFNPDPPPPDAVPKMRHFLRVLRELSE